MNKFESDDDVEELLKTQEDEVTPEYVKTAGFMSPVERYAEKVNGYVIIGHVTMMDFEDGDISEINDSLEKTDLSHVFVFRSSRGNYHGMNVTLRSLSEIYSLKKSLDVDDTDHAEVGWEKGRWTLRTEEKGEKDKPEYLFTWINNDMNIKEKVLSKPHLIALMELYDMPYAHTMLHECKAVGETIPIVSYETDENNHEKEDDQK